VETPAGLLVALPPCPDDCHEGWHAIPPDSAERCKACPRSYFGDVFDLAVPCYVRQQDEWLHDGQPFPCPRCHGTDWLINGRYRVLSITDEWPTGAPAVLGGVALIVEPVEARQ
jgi:hypothetical protein